ncbi:cation-transporting P-type ATPase [Brevibacterium sp. CS2]|uniref:cation-transporting P-type ATPase n=1 Tax=Brevibacterium sp. CS2 TaxID=2575923 RepID=UPI0010C78203|nr:cation-transporting P-type ATPase [Brevibacterium sp. CS2]QCP06056.1 cation-transporting P-type ATPase [Brevibacterium sp. CS2]
MTASPQLFSADRPPHALPEQDVLSALDTDDSGLDSTRAAEILAATGPNALPPSEQETTLQRLLRQFHDPMIYVLLAAAVFTGILGEVIDTIVILAVVLINALVAFFQEGKAADALESIRSMLSLDSEVLRDGDWTEVDAEELVPGDIVRLRAGDKVPADLRLLRSVNLRIEESALTGESVPAEKAVDPVAADAVLGDRSSMAYSGTVVAAGSGTGVVTATATGTEIGRITTMLSEVESMDTPLTRSMTRFSSLLAIVAVVLAVGMVLLSWLLYDHPWPRLLMSAIGFAVAAIPEGLPAVLAITLALGVQAMASRNAITRRMNSVETLGSVTTICSDKTGTLTRNEMTVREVVTTAGRFEVTGTGYAPDGEIRAADPDTAGAPGAGTEDAAAGGTIELAAHPGLAAIAEVAALANDSRVVERDGEWVLNGEPTDGGIRTFALKSGAHPQAERLAEVPFDSEYKYMATLDAGADGTRLVHLKGAPDRLLDRCDRQGDGPDAGTPLDRAHWEAEIDRLGASGLRVLAAAKRRADPGTDELTTDDVDAGGFVLLGLFGIIDPPREEAIEAIRTVQRAGVRVRMITGDHAGTATAIAREMGIGDRAITGAELEASTDEELREIVREHDVYARTSPEHKLRLVQALQADGEVVSMTGDGVNDAPSLKRADVGVAMGIKGTEATKEAADIVLTDDNFASIAAAVEMGRTIYDNLRKAIIFMLPTNGAQGLVILVAMVAGMTLPITPLQVLWVNLITAVTLSLALSFEPSEPGIMERPPRDPRASLLDSEAVVRIAYVSLLLGGATIGAFLLAQSGGLDLETSRTIAVHTLVVGQIFYLFASRFTTASSMRRELFTTNGISWLCVALLIGLQLAFGYLPFMQVAFATTAVPLSGWLLPVIVGVVVFLTVEVDKALRRRARKATVGVSTA